MLATGSGRSDDVAAGQRPYRFSPVCGAQDRREWVISTAGYPET
jgi:hypothetical protein